MSSKEYPARTLHLLDTELFSNLIHFTNQDERARLSYEKAKAIGLSYGMIQVHPVILAYSCLMPHNH